MGWFSPPPLPPPPQALALVAPHAGPYLCGLAFNIGAQILTVPFCILAFHLKDRKLVLALLAVVTAVLPLFAQPAFADYLVANGYANSLDVIAGRFCSSSTFALVAFRILGAAMSQTPKGADADLATWIAFATAACDPLFDKESGKPIKPSTTAVRERLTLIVTRVLGLSVLLSIALPAGVYPAKVFAEERQAGALGLAVAFYVDHVLVQLTILWLFLSLLYDIGCILLDLQGLKPLAAFENPVYDSRSQRDFWGRKWNLQVTTTLKRCFFIPLRHHLGLPPSVAATLTFVASALFHEYQFVLSFPKYQLGTISLFFVMHGGFSVLDTLYSKFFGKVSIVSLFGVPAFVQSLAVLALFSPTIPLFTKIWLDEDMFSVMGRLVPQVRLQ